MARQDISGLDEGMLKAVAEGIAENPDGAACLYTCDIWRGTIYLSPTAHTR
jgi:hypothetical protein